MFLARHTRLQLCLSGYAVTPQSSTSRVAVYPHGRSSAIALHGVQQATQLVARLTVECVQWKTTRTSNRGHGVATRLATRTLHDVASESCTERSQGEFHKNSPLSSRGGPFRLTFLCVLGAAIYRGFRRRITNAPTNPSPRSSIVVGSGT